MQRNVIFFINRNAFSLSELLTDAKCTILIGIQDTFNKNHFIPKTVINFISYSFLCNNSNKAVEEYIRLVCIKRKFNLFYINGDTRTK